MKVDRLVALATFLETLEPEKFDINFYHCGTTACSLGWAAQMPEFANLGLFIKDGNVRYSDSPFNECLYNVKAAERFFEIDFDLAEHLFLDIYDYEVPASAVTPKMAAARIMEVVETYREIHRELAMNQ